MMKLGKSDNKRRGHPVSRRDHAHRALTVLAIVSLLGGCVSQNEVPRLEVPVGAEPLALAEAYGQVLGRARLVSFYCAGFGITKTYNDTRRVIGLFVLDLREKGYSDAEIADASDRFTDSYNRTISAQVNLQAPEDRAEFCRSERERIAAGDNPGGLLTIR
jgi:hypothetical protein